MKAMAIIVVLSMALLSTAALADVPGLINYQGVLTDQYGVAADTTLPMTFAIYTDSTGGIPIWNEMQPAVVVSHGLFNVLLGKVNTISDTVFNGPSCWLEIQVGSDPEMQPRQRIVAVGYAFRAAEADTADYSRSALAVDDGDWTIDGDDMYSAVPGNVGIGTASPTKRLHVSNSTSSFGMFMVENSNSGDHEATIAFKEGSDAAGDEIWVAGVGGWGNTNDFIIGRGATKFLLTPAGNVGIGTADPAEMLHLHKSSGTLGVRMSSDSLSYQYLNFGATNGYGIGRDPGDKFFINREEPLGSGVLRILTIQSNGNVGIGTLSPGAKLEVSSTEPNIWLNRGSSSYSADFSFTTAGSADWQIYTPAGGSALNIDNQSSQTVQTFLQNGNVGIGVTDPDDKLEVNGNIQLTTSWPNISGENLKIWGSSGSNLLLQATTTGNVGIGTVAPGEKLTVRGNIRIESVGSGLPVVELGEGLDYAEGFDVSAAQGIAPGSVLIIDPDNPGKLTICDNPYDSKVAGIVAGARGHGSGVRLGPGQFDHDVALAGRVHCNVDATEAGVEPGDLLTTSATPGHAMKAADHGRAQGAILGKAMERLEKGQKGQILVLVTLQ